MNPPEPDRPPAARGGDLHDLKTHNRQVVLDLLRATGQPTTVRALERTTGLTRPTVTSVLTALIEQGYVEESATVHAGGRGGPRSRTYVVNARRRLLGGAVIRLQSVEVMVSDWLGTPLRRARIDSTGRDPRTLIEDELARMLDELGASSLHSLVVGVIGSVGPDGDLRRNEAIPAISAPNYFAGLGERFGARLAIENDANLAASAEFAHRPERSHQTMVGLHIDVAVGCGLVVNGQLVRGAGGYAAEMHYLPGSGWRLSHVRLLDAAEASGCTVAELFAAAGRGEVTAVDAVREYLNDIAPGILGIVVALNPELLVVGGDCSPAGDLIVAHLGDILAQTCPQVPTLHISALGDQCVILGAIEHAAGLAAALDPDDSAGASTSLAH